MAQVIDTMYSRSLHCTKPGATGEQMETDWIIADEIKASQLRKYLCDDGRYDFHYCQSCESPCKFGKRMLYMIDRKVIKPYKPGNSRKGNGVNFQAMYFNFNHTEKANAEVNRIRREMGLPRFDWVEYLMEEVARREPLSFSEYAGQDAEPEIISAVIQSQGFHNFSRFE